MGDNNIPEHRPLSQHFIPTAYTSASCIRIPNVQAQHYEIKTSVIQLLPLYYGNLNEEPYKHLDEFLEVCSTVRLPNVNEDVVRLILFPFSLKDRAKQWLNSLAAGSITTWPQMQQEFLKKYFPIGKTNNIRRAITSFTQLDGEEFYESWERLKEMLRKCPHHAVPRWQLVRSFYDGLTERHRNMVDASCGGTFMHKDEDELWQLFETLSENSMHHISASRTSSSSQPPRRGGIHEVSRLDDISSKLEALAHQFDRFVSVQGQASKQPPSVRANQDVFTMYSTLDSSTIEYANEESAPDTCEEQVQVA